MRIRDQLKTAEKHHTSPSPHSLVQADTSDQSNWHSSAGAVTIRVEAAGAEVRTGIALGPDQLEDTGAEQAGGEAQ